MKILMVHHTFYVPFVVRVKNARLKTNSKSKLDFLLVKTSAYQYAFYPHAISLWNSLPEDIHSCHTIMVFLKVT